MGAKKKGTHSANWRVVIRRRLKEMPKKVAKTAEVEDYYSKPTGLLSRLGSLTRVQG